MVRISKPRKASYRLGRRLKAGAKARLDYITYLYGGGNPAFGQPKAQGFASIAGGGTVTANFQVQQFVEATVSGGGAVTARFGEPRFLAAEVAGGGAVTAAARIQQRLAADFDGGGDISAHLFPPHRIQGVIDGGGTISAKIIKLQQIAADISGGGAITPTVVRAVGIEASIGGGGTVVANVDVLVPPVTLSATISGGGSIDGDIAYVDPDASTIIAAMVPTPTTTRQASIRTLVASIKSAGVWTKLDALYVMNAHSAQAARINWVKPGTFNLSEVGTPAFSVNDGYAGLTSPQSALNTGITPSTYFGSVGAKASLNSQTHFVYADATTAIGLHDYGVTTSGAELYLRINRNGLTTGFMTAVSGAQHLSDGTPYRLGLSAVTRVSSTTMEKYHGGISNSYANAVTAAPALPIHVCGYNATGTITGSTRQLKIVGFGSALTTAELNALQEAFDIYSDNYNPVNSEARTLVNAMTVKPSRANYIKIDNLIGSLKAASVWAKLDCLYVFKSHDAQAARLNWKTPASYAATVVGSPSFTANVGYLGNGGANGLNSNFNPSTVVGTQYALEDASLFTRIITDAANSVNFDVGCMDTTVNAGFTIRAQSGGTQSLRAIINSITSLYTTTPVINAPVMRTITRLAGEVKAFTQDGQQLGTTLANAATGKPNQNMGLIGAYTNGTIAGSARVHQAAGWGAALDATQIAALHNALNAYMN